MHIVLEHRFPETEKRLRELLKVREDEYSKLKQEYHALERRFGYEVLLNGELIDILKANGIAFREHLEYKKHSF